MSNTFYNTYWTSLLALVVEAWPEVDGKIWQDTPMNRVNWYNELQSGSLTVPWTVIRLDIVGTGEWVANTACYEITATIWYITSLEKAKEVDTTLTCTDLIAGKLVDLQVILYNDNTLGTTYSPIPLTVNADDPVNMSLVAEQNMNMQAGSLQATTLVVER